MQQRLVRIFLVLFLFSVPLSSSHAQPDVVFFNPYATTGPRIVPETVAPVVRKWYLPQTLYYFYGWKSWEYTNYSRDLYQRYVDYLLEGTKFYDIYGHYITRGWNIYSWNEQFPLQFGSAIFKHPNFSGWFNRVLISATSKGSMYTALTVGEAIRTTLTPLTFSKPAFDGLQWDFLTDKYGLTVLASRASNPATVAMSQDQAPSSTTMSTDLLGLRGVVQIGDFARTGVTYVNASHRNSGIPLGDNSMKGILGGPLNGANIRKISVRLSDDSPEDGVGGALLLRNRIFIDGVEHPEIKPLIEGGIRRLGVIEASGAEKMTLTYDIEHDFVPGLKDKITDYREIHKIEVGLVVANDYRIEVTSNMQTNTLGSPVFLLVTRSSGNITDGSNQRYVRFQYGLPTGNEVGGFTFDVTNFAGLNLRGEYVLNRRFRRFPNQNIPTDQALAMDRSHAFYVTASQFIYPWFGYAEVFRMDPEYSTSMFIPDIKSLIDYEKKEAYFYEFVDDNDDQDRFADWSRRYTGQVGTVSGGGADTEVFPGLDENNDLVSDFNQNKNFEPDYVEPFLRHDVDPPEFLFGADMNNNTVIDRFENDTEPDYPYKRDHRGGNIYTGVEITPGSRLMVGYLNERLISSGRENTSLYGLFALHRDFPRKGVDLQVMNFLKSVHDNIPDDLVQWVQPPRSIGVLQDFLDPLIAQNTLINTVYVGVDYRKIFPVRNKILYEVYQQRGAQAKGKRDRRFLGIVNKADYTFSPLNKILTLQPRWKQLYSFLIPTNPRDLRKKELSEIFSVLVQYEISKQFWIDSGVEYEIFNNLMEKPEPPPPGFAEDARTVTLATQLSIVSDYLGFRVTSKLGFRWNRKSFGGETKASSNALGFVGLYVGAQ